MLHPLYLLLFRSHEVRNPLNGTIGWLRFLEDECCGVEIKSMVSQAKDCTQLALNFLQNLSMMYKVQAGKLEQQPCPTVLSDVADRVQQVLQPQMADGVDFQLQCDELRALPPVNIDGSLLLHVLLNLCQNAARFTNRGRVSLIATVSRRHEDLYKGESCEEGLSGSYAISFAVRDTGPGISQAMQRKLFSRYSSEGGTGIGLHLSKELVKLFGSNLIVTSPLVADVKGQWSGTSFEFLVECRPWTERRTSDLVSIGQTTDADAAREQRDVDAGKGPHVDLNFLDTGSAPLGSPRSEDSMLEYIKGRRVLIADDMKTNRVLLSRVFASYFHCEVESVETAEEVCRLSSNCPLLHTCTFTLSTVSVGDASPVTHSMPFTVSSSIWCRLSREFSRVGSLTLLSWMRISVRVELVGQMQ